jgi:RNA polymerase sigma-70 factor (ECF subfamily)
MDDDELHISRIPTAWSMVRDAHRDHTAVQVAQQQLLDRYGGAIRRYALSALRSEDAAEEVFQDFALKFLRGDFSGANPERGRFRAFVKTIVYRMIVDYQRRSKKRGLEGPMHSNIAEPEVDDAGANGDDALFQTSWRDELLARCWQKLADDERKSGKTYHSVLRYRVAHPDLRSPELASGLSKQLGKEINAGAVRVLLHRSRELFGEMLLDEVAESLESNSLDDAEQELIDLELHEYCRPALEKRREQSK